MEQEFVLKNKKIHVDEKRHKYNETNKYFEVLSEEAMDKFVQLYKSRNNNIDDVYNKAFDQGNSCIADVIEKAVELLIKNGVFDIDIERFTEVYINSTYYSYWETAFDSIAEKYIMIVADNESLDEYRTQRRNSRGKFRGGGFGVAGAIKGSAKAGAMNMATGAVHGTFNLAAKGISSAFVASDKRKLFKDNNTSLTLANGIKNACYFIHYQYIDFLHQKRMMKYIDMLQKMMLKNQKLYSLIRKSFFSRRKKVRNYNRDNKIRSI